MTEKSSQRLDEVFVATVASYFDDLAPRWARNYTPQGAMKDRIERFAAALNDTGVPNNGHVLDFGCGTGTISRALAEKGYRLTGCDISREMISLANTSASTAGIRWVALDPCGVELPFDSGEFHAVIASSVFEYIPDPSVVLAQFRRVLRPDGVAICSVPDERHPVRVAERDWLACAERPLIRLLLGCLPRRIPYRQRYDYLRLSLTRWSAIEWQEVFTSQGFKPPLVSDCTDPLMVLCARCANNV